MSETSRIDKIEEMMLELIKQNMQTNQRIDSLGQWNKATLL